MTILKREDVCNKFERIKKLREESLPAKKLDEKSMICIRLPRIIVTAWHSLKMIVFINTDKKI